MSKRGERQITMHHTEVRMGLTFEADKSFLLTGGLKQKYSLHVLMTIKFSASSFQARETYLQVQYKALFLDSQQIHVQWVIKSVITHDWLNRHNCVSLRWRLTTKKVGFFLCESCFGGWIHNYCLKYFWVFVKHQFRIFEQILLNYIFCYWCSGLV